MFSSKKSKRAKATKRLDTLIGRQTHITGDISFTGGIRIDGQVEGNITTQTDDDSLLTLSEHGKVEGELRIPNLIINGQIDGNVYASKHVELAPNAKINGNVYYRVIEMAMGAEVNGLLIKVKDDEELLHVEHDVVDDEATFQLEQKVSDSSNS
jgi:cytoskeletal protein CcmA (bactofilin family)